jgi:beta-galactosidase
MRVMFNGFILLLVCSLACCVSDTTTPTPALLTERILLDQQWRFFKYADASQADALIYDVRPPLLDDEDGKAADAEPDAKIVLTARPDQQILKPWILPGANPFIADPTARHQRPAGPSPGQSFPFVQSSFDDSQWQQVRLPHDWAISGPFLTGDDAAVGGGMGRLPSPGVAWYRRQLEFSAADADRQLYLEVEGAMSYAMVWLNGQLVGGWPYGYASWRLDLTPYVRFDGPNQLAIRLDNPPASSRWYPGGGLYRPVWLVKTPKLSFSQWGQTITATPHQARNGRADSNIQLQTRLSNQSTSPQQAELRVHIYALEQGQPGSEVLARLPLTKTQVPAGGEITLSSAVLLKQAKLWGPRPSQQPHMYLAVSEIWQNNQLVDRQKQRFGIRDLQFDATAGLKVNGEKIYLQGANQHHDLGALGAAFHPAAARRQLLLLREMGVNAIRLAHNPPAPALLDLTDELGFLVINEIFDAWQRKKTPLDFHLIFDDWSEADLRALIRRDRHHPSVIAWSVGNEVGEQYTGEAGAVVARRLHKIAKSEDPSRPTAAAFNYAKPDMPISAVMDLVSLNYQGEGIRNAPAYQHLAGIRTSPQYPAFRRAFPHKLMLSSENAAAVSSRGEYLFPLAAGNSAPVADGAGGDPHSQQVSSYEIYTAPFGSSADKVLASLAAHPEVAGGFVWSGWDYLGEPTPYYGARSSYFGAIDLAGFKKDRFYLYQAAWRPDLPMVHILPHWNWPDRRGHITPVHVFTSGDAAELFINGISQGLKQKKPGEYRIRWDQVRYEPGRLKVVAYKNGQVWAEQQIGTTGAPCRLALQTEQPEPAALLFITIRVEDCEGQLVPTAKLPFQIKLAGATDAELLATDNGDPTDFTPFPANARKTFNGLGLAIVRPTAGSAVTHITVNSPGLIPAQLTWPASPAKEQHPD